MPSAIPGVASKVASWGLGKLKDKFASGGGDGGGGSSTGSGSIPWGAVAQGAGGLLGGYLGSRGGGGDGGASGDMRQAGSAGLDPDTQARQLHLWNQAQRYAAQNPYSREYGGASAMPGMSQMSQAGQQYTTDAILGPGAYQSQNLGFTDYERPGGARSTGRRFQYETDYNFAPQSGMRPSGARERHFDLFGGPGSAQTRTDLTPASASSAIHERLSGRDQAQVARDAEQLPLGGSLGDVRQIGGLQQPGGGGVGMRRSRMVGPQGLLGRRGDYDIDRSPTVGIGEMEDAALATRRMLEESAPEDVGYDRFLPGSIDPITGVETPGGWLEQAQAGIGATPGYTTNAAGELVPTGGLQGGAFGEAGQLEGPTYDAEGELVTPGYRPGYDAIRGQFEGVGDKRARTTPFGVAGRDPFTFGSIDPATGQPRVDPETGFPIGDVPAVTRGLISAQTGYGTTAYGEDGLDLTKEQRALSQIGQAGGDQEVIDPATGQVRSAAERISEQTIGGPGQFRDPVTGELITDVMTPSKVTVDPLTGETTTDVTAVTPTAFEGPGEVTVDPVTGQTTTAVGGVTADLIGGPGQVEIDPVTGQWAEAVGAVGPGTIAGPGGVTVDPVTGQVTEAVGAVGPSAIAGPQGLTVDPVTGQATQAVGGVAPGEFGGASFLGGPAIQDYMNQVGVEAQVAQSEEDYQRQLNQLQAQQAGTGAFGARAQLQDLGALEAQQRNIAAIRGAGFEQAAQRMEADIGRQQQAGLQTQQLSAQTGMAGQALEARRRESDAARAQQAAMQGQQLGFQGQLQTQQLAQAGGIRGAELGLQAQMQGQQLEAQRRSEDAARAQQAALAGQQLGTQAQMQTQQLAQAGDIRGAELGLQAQMQGQQLEAQRREAGAARAQQAAMAGQQLGTQAGMQTQQLAQAAAMRQAELGVQTGLAGQQLEAQRRSEDAARAQQAMLAGQQLGTQAQMQTQQLAQAGGIRGAELGLQAGMQGQQLEAQRREADAARAQQAALTGQQLGTQAQMQTQQLGFQGGMQAQQLGQQTAIRQAELGMEAARANQQTALTSGSQTQQIGAAREMRQAELNLQRQQQTQALGLEAGMQQAQFGQQAAVRQAELDLQREQATQGLGAEAFMQQQQLGQQAAIASASNALAAAQSDQQAALSSGNQAAALEASRRAQAAQIQVDMASQTQLLGADAAGQQARLEALRRQGLSEMGLEAGGMGLDAQEAFRYQQIQNARALASTGGMMQDATFAAGDQLAAMGAQQEAAKRRQQAFDYEQWLRGQEGGARELALAQSFIPGGTQQQFERKPSRVGQIGSGLLGAAGLGLGLYDRFSGRGGGGNGDGGGGRNTITPSQNIQNRRTINSPPIRSPLPNLTTPSNLFSGQGLGLAGVSSPLRSDTIFSNTYPGQRRSWEDD